ncbi:hypothetical protein AMJ52_08080 [candidate division TA06 bacterium DG_78]|uniref:Secretion system C-terminal sorting domain-containing protein n=1 Tax=candidate division TA06 bacterium DG_78 TaxID=1703772 RepID=A0A0S7YBU0_UNCT6|nr:MAG: hypothetical protein AMJ52_08080 [candidate division TA06 bacterium DG_78]
MWVSEIVTSGEMVIEPANIAVDSQGNPHIPVIRKNEETVFYTMLLYSKIRGSWIADTIETSVFEPAVVYGDLAIDCFDRIWVVYIACQQVGGIQYLIVARKDSSGWTKDTVDTGYGIWYSSIAADANGNPHVTYDRYLGEPHLYGFAFYAYNDGYSWVKEVVDTMISAYCCSIDADSSSYPHIAYCHRKLTGLNYFWRATKESGGWFRDEVDTGWHWMSITSIRISPIDNLPSFAYENAYGVRYARYNGFDWEIENVSTGISQYQKALDIDSLGQPYIVFKKNNKTWLAYKENNNNSWSQELLPESSVYDGLGSLRIDKNGIIHVVRLSARLSDDYREIWYIHGNVGIEENVSKEVESGFYIYPNPFGNTVKITAQEGDVDIYDISGRLVDSFSLQGTVEWNTKSLSSGVYFLRLKTEDSVVTKKVVKR